MKKLGKRIDEIQGSLSKFGYNDTPLPWTNMIEDGVEMYDFDEEET